MGQEVPKLVGVPDRADLSVRDEGDLAGLFGHDDDARVALLRDTDGGLVTHSVAGGNAGFAAEGQGAAGRDDAVVVQDDGAVMQGRILEEQVHQQALADEEAARRRAWEEAQEKLKQLLEI